MTYDVVLVQPQFDFKDYPNDAQDVIVRFSVPNFDVEQVQLQPVGIACSYLEDGTCSFSHNPIWTWTSTDNFCAVSSLY